MLEDGQKRTSNQDSKMRGKNSVVRIIKNLNQELSRRGGGGGKAERKCLSSSEVWVEGLNRIGTSVWQRGKRD